MQHATERFIVEWNNLMPLDIWWRRKYKVPFNSAQHRAINYLDVFYEWLEEQVWDRFMEENAEQFKNASKQPATRKEREENKKQEELFDILDNMDSFDALQNLNNNG